MDAIKNHAAKFGYAVYLTNGGQISKDELNGRLAAEGLPNISDRTYDHYGRLARKRQGAYMPINEFDMAVKHHNLPN